LTILRRSTSNRDRRELKCTKLSGSERSRDNPQASTQGRRQHGRAARRRFAEAVSMETMGQWTENGLRTTSSRNLQVLSSSCRRLPVHKWALPECGKILS
jgi:hypothetical protein